ncbi:MAG: peptide chain release factor N(5)-glutamine methyltransferase [Gemmatimonadaceae bacterium]
MSSDGTARADVLTVAGLALELQTLLGDASPRRSHDIIAALLDVPRFWPSSNARDAVAEGVCQEARVAVRKLRSGAPFAYAVGRATFRHLTLDVDERVLIPRPETEVLVDEVLRLTKGARGVAIDIGTGSGAIALSLASEGDFERVIATDVSMDALAVARRNASRLAGALRAEVEFRHGSLMCPVRGVQATVVVSNPPYISFAEAEALPVAVRDWEPALALLSGAEGMAATVEIIRCAADVLQPAGVLAVEVDTRRASLAAELLAVDPRYREVAVRLDLTGRERFVIARRA